MQSLKQKNITNHNHAYLEISTPTTGFVFNYINSTKKDILLYSYGVETDRNDVLDKKCFRKDSEEYNLVIRKLRKNTYSLIFVDPFHDFYNSSFDINFAYSVLNKKDGFIVIHDCLPPADIPNIANSEFVPGAWCGVTYKAFLTFTYSHKDIQTYVVDCDFGCGIISTKPRVLPLNTSLYEEFLTIEDDTSSFLFFCTHKHELLNIVEPINIHVIL
jgi:hypothetical protein